MTKPCTEDSNAFDDGEVCRNDDCWICEDKVRVATLRALHDDYNPLDRLYDRLDGDLARRKAYAEDMYAAGREHLLTEDEKDTLDT